METHLLLNLLENLGKRIRCEALESTLSFSPRNSINSINRSNHVRQYLSYDYKSS